IVVLTVEGSTVPGPSGAQLCRNLHAHGIDADELTVPMQNMSAGEAILHHSKELSADLIIKGAYTHSRLRQMIFGGATSHLLYNTDLPVLMAS
ncbi:MAG: universal stress protein, partial [Rhizobiaceae bacterium]